MFEKEAEEYGNEYWDCLVDCDDKGMLQEAYKDGAEFGYNKANEWHYVKDELPDEGTYLVVWQYPSKGEYPKEEKKVLCILGDFENDNLEVGYYSQVEGDSKRWRFEDYDLPDDSENSWGVSAWKEIVLPELKENK